MNAEIHTITDRNHFEEIFNEYFPGSNAFIQSKNGNVEVKYLGYHEGRAMIQFPIETTTPNICSVFTRSKDRVVISHLHFHEKIQNNVVVFNPLKFQIVSSPRYDNRIAMISETRKPVFVSGIVSESLLQETMAGEQKKLNRIKENIRGKNTLDAEYINIYFGESESADARLRYFREYGKPIYIPNFRNANMADHDTMINTYLRDIYPNDPLFSRQKELCSEITMPILYNEKIPYGYIQVNSTVPLSIGTMQSIKTLRNLAQSMEQELKLFSHSEAQFPVKDISPNGLGIVFNDRRHLSLFKQDTLACLDMHLPGYKKVSLCADIRHVDICNNNIIKIGFQIRSMDTMSADVYKKYLVGLKEKNGIDGSF